MRAAIIQARTNSRRLPGKVLIPIIDKSLLAHVIERVKRATLVDQVIVATTTRPEDIAICKIADEAGVDFFAGSEEDVLDRYYQTTLRFGADIVIRITADCPLLDPYIVDKIVRRHLEGGSDYTSNTLHRTYPDGLDVEVFSFGALKRAWSNSTLTSEREHVTSYIWKNSKEFQLTNVDNCKDLSALRWTIDEERDLRFVEEVYRHLYRKEGIFYMEDILYLLDKFPYLSKINCSITTNEGYSKSVSEDHAAGGEA